MKEKMKVFSEDEWLSDLAFKREMRLWEIEGDKRDEYEKGKKEGIQLMVIELFQNLYPLESSDFLNDCTIEQLKHITTMLIQKESIKDIQLYLKK